MKRMDGYKMEIMESRYPKHIQKLVQGIQNGTDIAATLESALPALQKDPSLQEVFKRLGYSKGKFSREITTPEVLAEIDQEYDNSPEQNKGLKYLSFKVKEIICKKGLSSYRQVADELIVQKKANSKEGKNVLRRVYDALNVLIAVGVITKTSKRYIWQGLGRSS